MPESEDDKTKLVVSKPLAHPKELSAEYHKAHKQLMLWAAILFVWEFVGIDLEKAKETEGYPGALVKSIKSPQAVPWVFLILVVYFLFKSSVEWAQCYPDRRMDRFARLDFFSAWIVSLAAIALYVGQAISRLQIADLLESSNRFQTMGIGVVAGFIAGAGISVGLFAYRARSGFLTVVSSTAFLLVVVILVGFSLLRGLNWKFALAGLVAGVLLFFGFDVYRATRLPKK